MALSTSSHTVNDVLTWVKRQFGDESGVQITDADIVRWVNQAQAEIANLADPIQAISTSALIIGQYSYQIPTEKATKIMSLRVDGRPLKDIEFQTAELRIATEDPERISSGMPEYWWRFADKLYLWPTPDQAYSIEIFYFKAPDDIAIASDILGVPDKYYEALIQFVMSKAYELDEEFDESRAAKAAFNDRLGLTMEDDARSAVDFYPLITFVD